MAEMVVVLVWPILAVTMAAEMVDSVGVAI